MSDQNNMRATAMTARVGAGREKSLTPVERAVRQLAMECGLALAVLGATSTAVTA